MELLKSKLLRKNLQRERTSRLRTKEAKMMRLQQKRLPKKVSMMRKKKPQEPHSHKKERCSSMRTVTMMNLKPR